VAPVRAKPRPNAEQVTQLLRGEPFDVLEEHDGWARIETAYGNEAWVEADAVSGSPSDGDWPTARGDDLLN
jgi:gamma-D-glutamyl-L-lysine dipeptidyl-peptidase